MATNAAIDSRLANFAAANAANPSVQSALESAAAQVKNDPARFLDADGTPDKQAMTDLLATHFTSVDTIVVPQAGTQAITVAGNLTGTSDADIQAFAFIVMMEAAKSAREDLKSIMDDVKATNSEKQRQRDIINGLHQAPAGCADNQQGCNESDPKETVKNKLDSLSEMGETESLRLQMAMDRVSKFMSTLSNLLKKESETSATIIQNIK